MEETLYYNHLFGSLSFFDWWQSHDMALNMDVDDDLITVIILHMTIWLWWSYQCHHTPYDHHDDLITVIMLDMTLMIWSYHFHNTRFDYHDDLITVTILHMTMMIMILSLSSYFMWLWCWWSYHSIRLWWWSYHCQYHYVSSLVIVTFSVIPHYAYSPMLVYHEGFPPTFSPNKQLQQHASRTVSLYRSSPSTLWLGAVPF